MMHVSRARSHAEPVRNHRFTMAPGGEALTHGVLMYWRRFRVLSKGKRVPKGGGGEDGACPHGSVPGYHLVPQDPVALQRVLACLLVLLPSPLPMWVTVLSQRFNLVEQAAVCCG